MFPDKSTESTKGAFTTEDLEYEWSLFRIVSRARRERNTREKMAARDPGGDNLARSLFLAGFFRVSLDGVSERRTTHSLQRDQFCGTRIPLKSETYLL